MVNSNKNPNRIYDSEIEAESEFPRFVIIEPQEETPLANRSLFLIEKKLPLGFSLNPRTVIKRSDNLLVNRNNKKHTLNLSQFKM